jgi:hypothetical protein
MHQTVKRLAGLLLIAMTSCCQMSCSSTSSAHPPLQALNQPVLNQTDYQVVVYGATGGGTVAAVAAARQGMKVALLEPGKHVGGMLSGGLGATDYGDNTTIGGISAEFFQRVGRYYGSAVAWQFEPHAAEQALIGMLNDAGVDVYLESPLGAVQKEGLKIAGIQTVNGRPFKAQVFIDASYEGDLMARSGVDYTVGREAQAAYGETMAGSQTESPQHQFDVPVSPFDRNGNLLPLITGADTAGVGSSDRKVQAYTFRLCMTRDTSNQTPFPRPAGYLPDRYEILRRYLAQKGTSVHLGDLMNLVPVPNGKTDTNNNGPISTDYVGGSWQYPEAEYAQRDLIKEEHKRYVQGFLYFLANDPSVPAAIHDEINQWGLAKDEFADNGNWPYQLYVREARRMIGEYVMTQQDLQVNRAKGDSIGMGSYDVDSHHVQRLATAQGTASNEGMLGFSVQPYAIPYRAITPQRSQCENLIVPVCLSASHVAFSSLRMEPQYMIMGQAAGVAASLAIKGSTTVQEVVLSDLQARLLSQGQVLALGALKSGIIVDNPDAVKTGNWTATSNMPGFIGLDYLQDANQGKGTKSARFIPNLPVDGSYEVQVSYTAASNRATNVPVQIQTADALSSLVLNERTAPDTDAPFVSLGTFRFSAGTSGYLEISNAGTNGYVVADAVRFVPVP